MESSTGPIVYKYHTPLKERIKKTFICMFSNRYSSLHFLVLHMNFQKMITLIIFPLHSLTLAIFIILLTLSTSNGDDHKYETCSSSLVSCGNLRNVGYPFWGVERPKYCGHPALQLLCPRHQGEEYPVLKIGDDDEVYYQVINISSSSSNMTIQLKELPKTCPFHSFNRVFDEFFLFRKSVTNITLFYDCHGQHMPDVPHSSISCWDNQTTTYYLNSTRDAELLKDCKTIEVPVLKNDLDNINKSTLDDVLKQGFEVELVDYLHFSDCSMCQRSGGMCESHDAEFACYHRQREQWKLIVKIAIPAGFFILIALNVGFWCCTKHKFYIHMLKSSRLPSVPMNSDLETGSSFCGIPILPYNELQEATNNFDESQELGDGGFGIVYYGKLRDGREVAVKRLYEKNYKRIEQFMNEIEILTRLRHPNLVTLYGCTSRNSRELLLVYEFIPNGTVADHLYGKRNGSETLSWDIRMKIAIETASALSYLHASEIIHRDVKTNNILLDNNFSVKVADFGLSRLFPCDATHVSTVPQGTPGYLDPQYHRNYQVTSKSDVYSFGVVLVELISSLPAVDISRQEDEINLYDYAMNKIQNGMLRELVDEKLDFELDYMVTRMITLVAELAFRCLQQEKELRPTMDEVLEALVQIGSTDYEALKTEDMNQSIAASKPTSLAAKDDTKPPDGNTQHPPSPNSVIVSWISRSTASNTSS